MIQVGAVCTLAAVALKAIGMRPRQGYDTDLPGMTFTIEPMHNLGIQFGPACP